MSTALPGSLSRRVPALKKWALIGLLAEVSLAVVLSFWLYPSFRIVYEALYDEDQTAGPDRGVTLSEVADHPSAMWGRTVTFSATVRERLGPNAIRIGDPQKISVGDEVLILAGQPLEALLDLPEQAPIEAGDVAQVTGVVRRFEPSELEAELGIELDAGALDDYETPSVLVAEAIFLDPPTAIGPGNKEFLGTSAGWDLGPSIVDLLEDTDWYLGQTVVISGEIEQVFGQHAFVVRDGGILVVSPEPRDDLFVEPTAYVLGEVRRFNADALEAEFDIDLSAVREASPREITPEPGNPEPEERAHSFEGEAVIVAEAIQVVT